MMKVQIDDMLTVECVSIAGYWNGWARPLFTREQLDTVRDEVVRNGGELYDIDGGSFEDSASVDMTTLDYVIRWDDLYEVSGWIWSTVDEPCFYCGYVVDSSVKCDCGAIS
jgi:hypothetical protein